METRKGNFVTLDEIRSHQIQVHARFGDFSETGFSFVQIRHVLLHEGPERLPMTVNLQMAHLMEHSHINELIGQHRTHVT